MFKDEKIVIFFRGKDESSNIISKIRLNIDKNKVLRENTNIEYINLDKRNVNKFIQKIKEGQISKPTLIYIYFKELKTISLLRKELKDDCIIQRYNPVTNIIDDFKNKIANDYPIEKYWSIINNELLILEFDIFNIANKPYSFKKFVSEKECKDQLKKYIENEIENYSKTIQNLNQKIDDLKERLTTI